MRGKKARAIRKLTYMGGDGRNRGYFLTNRRERKVEVPVRPLELDNQGNPKMTEITVVTHTVVADHRRRMCKYMKRHSKDVPLSNF